jgi:hypothetical protein
MVYDTPELANDYVDKLKTIVETLENNGYSTEQIQNMTALEME